MRHVPAGSDQKVDQDFIPRQPARVHNFHPGSVWLLSGHRVVIQHLLDPGQALVQHIDSGRLEPIPVARLNAVSEPTEAARTSLKPAQHPPEVWERAVAHTAATQAFWEEGDRSPAARKALASSLQVSDRHLQRKLKLFDELQTVESWLPAKRGPKKGSTQLRPDTEVMMRKEIERLLAVSPSISAREVHGLISAQLAQGQKPPGVATVSRRLSVARRNLDLLPSPVKEEAKYRVKPLHHRTKSAFPLDLVQVDHAIVDVHIRHPDLRDPIGRAVLTLMVDEATRVIPGFCLSLEAPSRLSVGLCLVHVVQPKDNWLASLGEPNLVWPGYGLPRRMLTDNASSIRHRSG